MIEDTEVREKAATLLLHWIEWREEMLNDVYTWWICPTCGAEKPNHEQGCWLDRILKGGERWLTITSVVVAIRRWNMVRHRERVERSLVCVQGMRTRPWVATTTT